MNTQTRRAFATQIFITALFMLGVTGGLGFSIVDFRQRISVSANNARVLEQRTAEASRRLAEIGGSVATEQSPEVLERRNQTLALGLSLPAEARVLRVGVSAGERLAAKRNAEIFASEHGLVSVPIRFNLGGAAR
jgi:hypothetical protein